MVAYRMKEETAKRLPGCRLVKAFNTIYWEHLGTQGDSEKPLPERRAIFLAGDDRRILDEHNPALAQGVHIRLTGTRDAGRIGQQADALILVKIARLVQFGDAPARHAGRRDR